MRRHVSRFAAALLLPCGAAALCAVALAPRAAGQSGVNMNGNMTPSAGTPTSNTNTGVMTREPLRPRPTPPRPAPPAVRWSPVGSVTGYISGPQLTIRAGAGTRAAVIEELDGHNYEVVEILEAAGDFVRARFETGGHEKAEVRKVEGWVAWGEVVPQTTALVLDARTGRVLSRHALGSGIDSVSFSPDGKRALFHGQWAPSVYEADAADLAPVRRLTAEGEGSFNPSVYVGSGHDLLTTLWAATAAGERTTSTLYAVRADGGGQVTAAPFARSPAGAEPSQVVFAPDGRAGFAFYTFPYGDEEEIPVEEDRGSVATVEVFDPLTMQTVRRFKLPDPALAFESGALAMNADGSQLYLLDQTGQRLVVVETHAGGVLREVSLAGQTTRMLSLARETVGAAGPLIRYWDATAEDHAEVNALRVEGGRAVDDDSGHTFTVEAGGVRYAVDDLGLRLFTLGPEGRPASARDIQRRGSDSQMPVGLFATPDGSRLILLLSLPEDGC